MKIKNQLLLFLLACLFVFNSSCTKDNPLSSDKRVNTSFIIDNAKKFYNSHHVDPSKGIPDWNSILVARSLSQTGVTEITIPIVTNEKVVKQFITFKIGKRGEIESQNLFHESDLSKNAPESNRASILNKFELIKKRGFVVGDAIIKQLKSFSSDLNPPVASKNTFLEYKNDRDTASLYDGGVLKAFNETNVNISDAQSNATTSTGNATCTARFLVQYYYYFGWCDEYQIESNLFELNQHLLHKIQVYLSTFPNNPTTVVVDNQGILLTPGYIGDFASTSGASMQVQMMLSDYRLSCGGGTVQSITIQNYGSLCSNGNGETGPPSGSNPAVGEVDIENNEILSTYYGFGGPNGASDAGRLSCRSFVFRRIGNGNSMEAGIKDLVFNINLPYVKKLRVFKFKPLFINMGIEKANGVVRTAGEAAEASAVAANAAGALLSAKYGGVKTIEESRLILDAVVVREFIELYTALLQTEVGGYAAVREAPLSSSTVVKAAVWNGPIDMIFNVLGSRGCAD